VEAGLAVPELCGALSISLATFYRWRSKDGDMDVWCMTRMKELEAELARLRKICVEENLRAEIVTEALEENWRPSRRREMGQRAGAYPQFCVRGIS
jgi:putative transposase